MRSLKKQKQRLKAAHDTLNRRWNKVLDTEGKHGDNPHTKSYPKRKLLPEFDNEAAAPVRPKNNTATQPDQQPHGRDRAATDTARDLRECHAQYVTLSKRNSKVPPRIDPHIETLLQGRYHYINIT